MKALIFEICPDVLHDIYDNCSTYSPIGQCNALSGNMIDMHGNEPMDLVIDWLCELYERRGLNVVRLSAPCLPDIDWWEVVDTKLGHHLPTLRELNIHSEITKTEGLYNITIKKYDAVSYIVYDSSPEYGDNDIPFLKYK